MMNTQTNSLQKKLKRKNNKKNTERAIHVVVAVADWKSKMKNTPHDRIVLQEILAITAGLFMSIGGITSLLMNSWNQSMPSGQFMKDAMMISWWQLIMPQTYLHVMWAMAALSLIAGIIVIVCSYKIHKEPEKIRVWFCHISSVHSWSILCKWIWRWWGYSWNYCRCIILKKGKNK